jgi:hypothetical protein
MAESILDHAQPKKFAHRWVVTVDDPGRSAGRGVHVLREGRPRHPARTILDRVEFHACHTQPRRERSNGYRVDWFASFPTRLCATEITAPVTPPGRKPDRGVVNDY